MTPAGLQLHARLLHGACDVCPMTIYLLKVSPGNKYSDLNATVHMLCITFVMIHNPFQQRSMIWLLLFHMCDDLPASDTTFSMSPL